MKIESSEHLLSNGKRISRTRRYAQRLLFVLFTYLLVAYLIAPEVWKSYLWYRPFLDDQARITTASDGHPGDPLNVGLIGSEAEVNEILRAAGWYAADPLSVESDLKIGADTILGEKYNDAPVSSLYLFGRREDMAFEQPVAENPSHRHHVRFWLSEQRSDDGRPFWVGSASFDDKVGFSHTTGQVTHHIAADVDLERDYLLSCLRATLRLMEIREVPGFHSVLDGRNGGGDPWHTDGVMRIGVIRSR